MPSEAEGSNTLPAVVYKAEGGEKEPVSPALSQESESQSESEDEISISESENVASENEEEFPLGSVGSGSEAESEVSSIRSGGSIQSATSEDLLRLLTKSLDDSDVKVLLARILAIVSEIREAVVPPELRKKRDSGDGSSVGGESHTGEDMFKSSMSSASS